MSFIDKIRDRLFGFTPSKADGVSLSEVPIRHRETPISVPETTDNHASKADTSFPKRILFVCSGNICRSAYAEAKLKLLAQGMDAIIISAGTLRIVGRKAAPEMIDIARENGVNLDEHRSSALSRVLIDSADIIFAMAPEHRDIIVKICPDADKRVLLLGMFLNDPQEIIEDPMGQTIDVYRAVVAQIDEALSNWFERHAPHRTEGAL